MLEIISLIRSHLYGISKSYSTMIHLGSSPSTITTNSKLRSPSFRTQLLNFEMDSASFGLRFGFLRCMFSMRFKIWQWSHRQDLFIEVFTISYLVAFGITGKVCLKSPPSRTVLPLKILSSEFLFLERIKSLNVLSTASNTCLLFIGTSYQTIRFACLLSSVGSNLWLILQHEYSSVSKGMLNHNVLFYYPGVTSNSRMQQLGLFFLLI